MVVSHEEVVISDEELFSTNALLSSDRALGNGSLENISDIVYVKPGSFDAKHSPKIAGELETVNKSLTGKKTPYLLIGFGRWGSSDPWLGIP
jgi:hypothetical protein